MNLNTTLALAVDHGASNGAVNALLDEGANPWAIVSTSIFVDETAMGRALRRDNVRLFRLLRRHGGTFPNHDYAASAAKSGAVEIMRALVAEGADFSFAFMRAQFRPEMWEPMLAAGVEIDPDEWRLPPEIRGRIEAREIERATPKGSGSMGGQKRL